MWGCPVVPPQSHKQKNQCPRKPLFKSMVLHRFLLIQKLQMLQSIRQTRWRKHLWWSTTSFPSLVHSKFHLLQGLGLRPRLLIRSQCNQRNLYSQCNQSNLYSQFIHCNRCNLCSLLYLLSLPLHRRRGKCLRLSSNRHLFPILHQLSKYRPFLQWSLSNGRAITRWPRNLHSP